MKNLGRFTVRYKVFLLLVAGETQSTVSVDTRDGLPSLTWRPTYWVRTPIVNALGPRPRPRNIFLTMCFYLCLYRRPLLIGISRFALHSVQCSASSSLSVRTDAKSQTRPLSSYWSTILFTQPLHWDTIHCKITTHTQSKIDIKLIVVHLTGLPSPYTSA